MHGISHLYSPQRYRRVAIKAGRELQQHGEGGDVGERQVARRGRQHGLHARLDGGAARLPRPHAGYRAQPKLVVRARLRSSNTLESKARLKRATRLSDV